MRKPAAKRREQRKRIRRPPPRPTMVKVCEVHCKDCKRSFEIEPADSVKFCIWCRSANIQKSERVRKETPEERSIRHAAINARMVNTVLGFISQFVGGPPNFSGDFIPPRGVNKSALEEELLKEGYRKLAIKYHPDKGGDPEKMRELNRLKQELGL